MKIRFDLLTALIFSVLLGQVGFSQPNTNWKFGNKNDFEANVLMPRIEGSKRSESTDVIERILGALFHELETLSQDIQFAEKLVVKFYKKQRPGKVRGHLTVQFSNDFSQHIYHLDVDFQNRSYDVIEIEDFSFPDLVVEIGRSNVSVMMNQELVLLAILVPNDQTTVLNVTRVW